MMIYSSLFLSSFQNNFLPVSTVKSIAQAIEILLILGEKKINNIYGVDLALKTRLVFKIFVERVN